MNLNKVIIALDFSRKEEALRIVDELDELIDFYKIGLELFLSEGESILNALKKREKKIFLDLKFHDIPNTVQRAVKASLNFGVDMLTLHTLGGIEMMKRAKEVVEEEKIKKGTNLRLLGVTILTSQGKKDLEDIFSYPFDITSLIKNLATLSKKNGLDGVIASANEISSIKEICGKDFLVVTPGIRAEKINNDDQRRIATPKEAFTLGADYIVIGRAITFQKNPKQSLIEILK